MVLSSILTLGACCMTAQTRLLHYWHFNNTLPASGGGGTHLGTGKMNSDYTKPSITTGYLRYVKHPQCVKDTGYWDNYSGDTINQRIGYAGCCPSYSATTNNCSVRMRNPSDSMMFLWYIPTTNFMNIKIKFEAQASSTGSGQHRMNYEYSLDSGATYVTGGLPRLFDSAGTGWGKVVLDLSGISSVNNNKKLMIRIKFSAPNTGTSGNNRYDNISIEGDSISTAVPTGLSTLDKPSPFYHIYPNPSNDHITISGTASGPVVISIIDLLGNIVYTLRNEALTEEEINISGLNKGPYYIRITNELTKNTETLKFLKN